MLTRRESPTIGGSIRAGAVAGLAAGVALAVADPAVAVAQTGQPVSGIWAMITRALTVHLPLLTALGAACGPALYLVGRVSTKLLRVVIWALPAVWVLAHFLYWSRWLAGSSRGLGLGTGAKLALLSLVSGLGSYALLWGLAVLVARRPATRKLAGVLVAAALLWVAVLFAGRGGSGGSELPSTVPPSTSERPNVLLIVLDTVRADHLSCYGYHRKTTPNLDAFANQARLYRNVLSPGSWTLPTHASFFTGLPATSHGCNRQHQFLDQRFDTLAERLRSAGYQTVGLSSNWMLTPGRGFDQGFELYDNPEGPGRSVSVSTLDKLVIQPGRAEGKDVWSNASAMHRRLGEWFRQDYRPDRPFFIFLNYIEAHAPYVPPSGQLEWSSPEVRTRWQSVDQQDLGRRHMFSGRQVLTDKAIGELEALYDDEISYVDRKVGELLDFLENNQLDGNTLVIITADHGEHFGEHHLMGHQFSVYEPLVRVPLIVRFPGRIEPGEHVGLVQSHALFATVLGAAGVERQESEADGEVGRVEHAGRSLLGPEPVGSALAFAEYLQPDVNAIAGFNYKLTTTDFSRFLQPLRAVRRGELKLVWRSGGQPELYDLSDDPGETRDLAGQRPEDVRALRKALEQWLASIEHYQPPPEAPRAVAEPSPKEVQHLRDLGYVQ